MLRLHQSSGVIIQWHAHCIVAATVAIFAAIAETKNISHLIHARVK